MDALEALLTFCTFICWADATASTHEHVPKCFSGNWKRSAGPLKKLFYDLIDSGLDGHFLTKFRSRADTNLRAELDRVINGLDAEKHHKQAFGACDAKPLIERLGNVCRSVMKGWAFGYCEDLRPAGFLGNHEGFLRVACGAPPFHQRLRFSSPAAFPDIEAVMVSLTEGQILRLAPLIVWHRGIVNGASQDCLVLDGISRQGLIEYKRIGASDCMSPTDDKFEGLSDLVHALFEGHHRASRISGAKVQYDPEQDF